MNTKNLIIILLLCGLFSTELKAQLIEVNEIYHQTSDYAFGDEWQYLSTDLYLMNAGTMDKLLSDCTYPQFIRQRLKSVFISAKLQGSILEGLEYPLYNFMKNIGNNRMDVVDNYDAVTIIKNMPLSGNDNISAEISVEAVTNDSKTISNFVNNVFEKISIFSRFTSLTGAVGALKDELTKISANSDKKYVFNSTIQIYKDFDPDRKIHSIGVYLFHNRDYKYERSEINFDGIMKSNSDYVNKATLQSAMQNSALPYPYLIVVNYKSKYVSELDTKAEITARTVSDREKSIESKKQSNEINSEIFSYEKRLNDFLNKYAAFYETVANEYKYNKGKDVVSKIINQYKDLCSTKEVALKNFSSNGLFFNCFQKHYEDIVNKADIELSYYPELIQAKDNPPLIGVLSEDKSTIIIEQKTQADTTEIDENEEELMGIELEKKVVEAKLDAKKAVRKAKNCISAILNCGFSISDNDIKEDMEELSQKKNALNTKKDSVEIADKQAFIDEINILTFELNSLADELSKSFQEIQLAHDKEIVEKERIAREQAEKEAAEQQRLEQERIAQEQAEKERLAMEQAEKERLAKEQAERERIAQEQAEKERLAREQAEKERLAKEQAERERIAREQAEKERIENLKYRVVFKDYFQKEITMTDYETENFKFPKSIQTMESSFFEWNTRRDGSGSSYEAGSFWEYDEDDKISEYFDDADQDRESRTITLYPVFKKYGTLTIYHGSNSLYYIYIDDKLTGKFTSVGTYSIKLSPGTHKVYVEQQSGYFKFPTRDTRTITIEWGKETTLSGPQSDLSDRYFR